MVLGLLLLVAVSPSLQVQLDGQCMSCLIAFTSFSSSSSSSVLSAAAVDGVSTLFWYNQSTRLVHRYSRGSVQNVTKLPEGTSLTGMSAHYKSESQREQIMIQY